MGKSQIFFEPLRILCAWGVIWGSLGCVLSSVLSFLSFLCADWVEFSPYEIGMAKYGTFMPPNLFGSKFFMGTEVKRYTENPLHFLMGKQFTVEKTKQLPTPPTLNNEQPLNLFPTCCSVSKLLFVYF